MRILLLLALCFGMACDVAKDDDDDDGWDRDSAEEWNGSSDGDMFGGTTSGGTSGGGTSGGGTSGGDTSGGGDGALVPEVGAFGGALDGAIPPVAGGAVEACVGHGESEPAA